MAEVIEYLDKPVEEIITNWNFSNKLRKFIINTINSISPVNYTFTPLTDSLSSIKWDGSKVINATLLLTANRIINIYNLKQGQVYTLKVLQTANSLTLTTLHPILSSNNGLGLINLTGIANSIDIITFIYDGTQTFCDVKNQYT